MEFWVVGVVDKVENFFVYDFFIYGDEKGKVKYVFCFDKLVNEDGCDWVVYGEEDF